MTRKHSLIIDFALIALAVVFMFVATSYSQSQVRDRDFVLWGGTGGVASGQQQKLFDIAGTITNSFEIVATGTAATTQTVVILGCMRGGTCSPALVTNTTIGSYLSTGIAGGPYDNFPVTITWTGGDATTAFRVNRTGTVARSSPPLFNSIPTGGVQFGSCIYLNDPSLGVSQQCCLNKNSCFIQPELTKLADNFTGGTAAGGTISPTANLSNVGRLWSNQGFLGANNFNNVTNICAHEDFASPTISNFTTDAASPTFQPTGAVCPIFANTVGPTDEITATFYLLCSAGCAAASTQIQVRLAGPTASCTLNDVATSIGAANQVWQATVEMQARGGPPITGEVLTLDRACGGTTCSAPQKTQSCTDTLSDGFMHSIEILIGSPSSGAAIVTTLADFQVLNRAAL